MQTLNLCTHSPTQVYNPHMILLVIVIAMETDINKLVQDRSLTEYSLTLVNVKGYWTPLTHL